MGNLISHIAKLFHPDKDYRLLILGLDNAGKTTLLQQLKFGERMTTIPTIGFNVETVEYENLRFVVWDIGGQDKIRSLWRHYYVNTNALIYVIDSSDKERLQTAKYELEHVLVSEELAHVPVLLFANKQDLKEALPLHYIQSVFAPLLTKRKWKLEGCSAYQGKGVLEGFQWIRNTINE